MSLRDLRSVQVEAIFSHAGDCFDATELGPGSPIEWVCIRAAPYAMIIITCLGAKPFGEEPLSAPEGRLLDAGQGEAKSRMSRRTRWIVFLVGLLILVCSLLAVGYALWPAGAVVDQATLAPTLFAPP
jgi:hypothetical protein